MKKARYVLRLFLIGILVLNLTACGNKVADEGQIKQELGSSQSFNFLKVGEQIDEIVIVKRQTDKEQKLDTVWCTITTNDTEVSYQKEVTLTYGLYDKEGWILDNVDVNAKQQWIMTPLKGINDNDVLASLYGHTVVVDNEEWQITKDNLLNAEVIDHQTNLDEKRDQVTVSLTLNEEVERAEGEIEVSYFFNQGWVFDSVLSNKEFMATMKEEYALNVTDQDIINEMSGMEIAYNGNGSQGKQTVIVNLEEISDFKIDEHTSEAKGSSQVYYCNYNLNKPHVVLGIEAVVTYSHRGENGWAARISQPTSKVISTNISGDWSGTYSDMPWDGTAELHITEIQEDGSVTAVYRFIPDSRSSDTVGSYELSGYWDEESLRLILKEGEWIEKPNKVRISNQKQDITAQLDIEKDRFEGYAPASCRFRVTKED